MFRNIITTAFLVFAYITCNAQSSDGTMLLDDATSQTRVVTNAFLNASNSVHELIQNVSPTPDFTTNNQTLVDTIVDVSSAPYLSDYELKSELTNDVCTIVTNSVSFYTSTEYDKYNAWEIDQDSATFNISDVEWIDSSRCNLIGNGVAYTIDTLNDSSSQTICIDRKAKLYIENAYTDIPLLSMPDQWELYYEISETGFNDVATPLKLETQNTLGLARLSDIAPSISNTVTKAYIEDLGIESGVDAQTVTNMTTLAPVYSQTPMFQWTCRIGWDEGDGFTGASWSNDVWSVSFIYYGQAYTMPATVVEGTGAQATKLSFDFDGGTYFATRIRTDIIGYTLGAQINSILAATNGLITSSITNGLVTASITNGLVTSEITNGLASATITNGLVTASVTNGLLGADAISTNNAAFVTAVTNCPVVIAAADAEALTEWGIYGGGGTIGALLAALAAAVAALKKKKMPLYPVGGTGNPVNATYESGVLTVSTFAMAAYTPTASAAFSVTMGALPSDMEAGKARDAVLVIDCTSLTEGQEPTVTWDAHFHPRTDAGTDFACAAGVRNVYYISEYAAGEYAVGGWVETDGGYSPNGGSGT